MRTFNDADMSHIRALVVGVLQAADDDVDGVIGWEVVDEANIVAEMIGVKWGEDDATEEG